MIDQVKKKEIVNAYITAILSTDDVEKNINHVGEITKHLSLEEIQECREEALAFIYSEPVNKNQVN